MFRPFRKNATQRNDEEKFFVASQWQLFRWKFLNHKLAVVSLFFLGFIYLGAIFAEFISPFNPHTFQPGHVFAPPQKIYFIDESGKFHWQPFVYPQVKTLDPETYRPQYSEDRTQMLPIELFVPGETYKFWGLWEMDIHLFGVRDGVFNPMGKDSLGRDLLTRIIYGSRISLSIGLIGVIIGFFSGLLIGGLAGLLGGVVDIVIMRITEIFNAIPSLPLWMALSVALPQNWTVEENYIAITVILTLFGVVSGASRDVRGKFFALKEEDFVMAAKLDGAGNVRLIMKYLFPNFLSHQIAGLTMSIPGMILGETSLSFLGLGLQPPAISWGVLLQEGRSIKTLAENPWLFIPAIFVVLTIISFNFVGDGIRDAADPYARV